MAHATGVEGCRAIRSPTSSAVIGFSASSAVCRFPSILSCQRRRIDASGGPFGPPATSVAALGGSFQCACPPVEALPLVTPSAPTLLRLDTLDARSESRPGL
eukprot:189847-Chlamydomonas_euryale.AAC.4